MKHTIAAMVENKPGVLAKISGLFSARAFNIMSLTVGETEVHDVSRMTIVVKGDDKILEQVVKQLNKLPDVIKVIDFKNEEFIERDLMLVKVNAPKTSRSEIVEIATIFRANILDISADTITLELTGRETKLEGVIRLLRPYGIKEMVRAGVVAMSRGRK
ncbi:MAG: acetolactate synthase small subunit [Candidatus Omnitrophota bacterium]|nr:acetolactate synthase small subunit [Candidatus Omnitrophota bacterium]MBU2529190.1 acetolactate synthase small subunit [bacterium]MBU3930464.1 acetolactate synthase small subunit [bacterium]MBU4122907.1 acetolactate synthase small subunit [bacterium]